MARHTQVAAANFTKTFNAEYLAARRDVTRGMVAAAEGDVEAVRKCLKEGESKLTTQNKDGNTMLLLAVANNQAVLAQELLELKADAGHKNAMRMDALDYAVQEGVHSPVAKTVLQHYDFVTPEVVEGPHWQKSNLAVAKLRDSGFLIARSLVIGRRPDFSDVMPKDTEYRNEWTHSLRYMVDTVKRGIVLLNHEIEYLERDALLTGALEVPTSRRFVYDAGDQAIIRFSTAVQTLYRASMHKRIVEATRAGEAVPVQGLLKAQAQPNLEDARGQTVLMHAAHAGNPIILNCLVQAKAAVNAQNKDGFTALFLAAVEGNETAVRVLLKAKADLNIKSYQNNTVMDFVKHQNLKGIRQIISEERHRLRDAEAKKGHQR